MHTVDNLIISCIDFRFRANIAKWIKKHHADQSDLVKIAGASKAILDEDTRATVLKQIDIASRLHNVKAVTILDHIDCGAYGGSKEFNNDEPAEKQMHVAKLMSAKAVVAKKFPNLKVKTAIINHDGSVSDI